MPVERTVGGTSLIDVLDRVLDKGIVIDAWVRVSLVGIDLITVEARIVVASIETYLKYSEAVGQLPPISKPAALEPARASDTPLAVAARSEEAVPLRARGPERRRVPPRGRVRLLAPPMFARVGREEAPAGLLLVSPPEAELGLVAWVASVLASPLVRLGRTRFL